MTLQTFTLGTFAQQGVAAGDFDSIATISGTGSSGEITFSSIPSTYQHLQVRYSAMISSGGSTIYLQVNSSGGSNYARHRLVGNGTTATTGGNASTGSIEINGISIGLGTTHPGSGIIDILDYASTSKNKTIRSLGGTDMNGSGEIDFSSGVWLSTSAITSITIGVGAGNFTTNAKFALYGIKAA